MVAFHSTFNYMEHRLFTDINFVAVIQMAFNLFIILFCIARTSSYIARTNGGGWR